MPSLTNSFIQRIYVDRVIDFYDKYPYLTERARQSQFKETILEVAHWADLPKPVIRWGNTGGGFDHTRWLIELDNRVVTINPHAKQEQIIHKWLYFVTMPYHEACHCEQDFQMVQAMLTGAVPIPLPLDTTGRPMVLPSHLMNDRILDIQELDYPLEIIREADQKKWRLSQDVILSVRSWVKSKFGSERLRREQTLENLKKGKRHWRAYRNLVGERDAFDRERAISLAVRAAINERGSHKGHQGLRTLFRD